VPVILSPPTNQHLIFLQTGCPYCRPTNSVWALKDESITFRRLAHPKLTWRLASCYSWPLTALDYLDWQVCLVIPLTPVVPHSTVLQKLLHNLHVELCIHPVTWWLAGPQIQDILDLMCVTDWTLNWSISWWIDWLIDRWTWLIGPGWVVYRIQHKLCLLMHHVHFGTSP